MSEELLVNVTPMETRVALVDNGATQEVRIERSRSRGLVGNIYAGRVVRVLPGMQAAFVDIGAERTSFIHVSDLLAAGPDMRSRGNILNHLHEGQKLVVQVTKEPVGGKGARLTTELSLSSRYLVFMPHAGHVGVSQRIVDAAERERLQALLQAGREAEEMAGEGGYILRTAAQGVGAEELRADLRYLKRVWAAVSRRTAAAHAPALVYEELPLHLRTVRDLVRAGVERILVDCRESYLALQEFCTAYTPEVLGRLEFYAGERPLFDLYGVETEIGRALERKVELKSGGYLVFDQTEAMSTIDVNTGSYVGRRNLEETIFKTNLEAAGMLARQVRLRNLGGIVIVDFIDMLDEEHRREVHRVLEKAIARDPARTRITGVSELGLVEMTRERTRESLAQLLCEPCPVCQGRGALKTAETVCYEIFREIMRDARAYENRGLMVVACQGVIDRLLDEESDHVADLQELTGKVISLRVEPENHPEHFDIVLL